MSSLQLQAVEALVRLDENFDVPLLDRVVAAFYQGHGPDHSLAQRIITQLQEHPDAWQKVDFIMEGSSSVNTKFIALQILERLIQTRWNALPREQCDGIKNYIVTLIIRTSGESETGTMSKQERMLLGKLNLILVQVLKQEWPKRWPTFISEIVASSRTSIALCENNMAILKLLSEEVFDYSAEQMTTVKAKSLKTQLCGEFSDVFALCTEVLERATKPSLVSATLEALLRFLRWIPLGYIFETNLVENLRTRFLAASQTRNVTLKCLTEISALNVPGDEYNDRFIALFRNVLQTIGTMVPHNQLLDLNRAYQQSGDDEQRLVQNLAQFFSASLGSRIRVLENGAPVEEIIRAHEYLIALSMVEDREIFKVCLEYWAKLVSALYNDLGNAFVNHPSSNPFFNAASTGTGIFSTAQSRKITYSTILSRLRIVMIERMVKPEEVLVVEDDNGEIVREAVKETDTITLYKGMREVLVYLTHLDCSNTEAIMTSKLARQLDGSEWSWTNVNRLCWAIGSVSGAMDEEVEKRFLVNVIRDLLALTEMKRGKDNKAVVASNIMYIVGQYPRFLRAHWKFLKTVVNKLFEFMHELHEGVQDMACDTFIKIAKKCRRQIVTSQYAEEGPFLDEILTRLDGIVCDLQASQVHTVFEALGHVIRAASDRASAESYVSRLLELPNRSWDEIVRRITSQSNTNMKPLQDQETLRSLANILRSNASASGAVGPAFRSQMARLYSDMLALYVALGQEIVSSVASGGPVAVRTPLVRAMRSVRKESLRLVEAYLAEGVEDVSECASSFAPALLEAILGDYGRCPEQARDAEVLSCTAALLNRLTGSMNSSATAILESTLGPTLSMISREMSEYPEHRVALFALLGALVRNNFEALEKLAPIPLRTFIDALLWGAKHAHRDVSDLALSTLHAFVVKAATSPLMSPIFCREHYMRVLNDAFAILTDADHKAGFKWQASLLAHLFHLVQAGLLSTSINNISESIETSNDPLIVNRTTLHSHMMRLLPAAFPHLQSAQIDTFVRGLFDLNQDLILFKEHLRDFLVALREFSAQDATDLWAEERELEAERKAKAERDAALLIPGLVKPMDRDDDISE